MKSLYIATTPSVLLIAATFAYHPAIDMVDSEIYAIIDALVAETPHADHGRPA